MGWVRSNMDWIMTILVFNSNPNIKTRILFESKDYIHFIYHSCISPQFTKIVSFPYPTRSNKINVNNIKIEKKIKYIFKYFLKSIL